MKPRLFGLFSIVLLLPLGLKLGVPILSQYAEAKLSEVVPEQQYTIEAVEGYTLRVRAADQSRRKVRLAALQPGQGDWQNQAAAITTLMLSSQATVRLTHVQPSSQSDEVQAIAYLPNGTLLQQVLLSDGLAKLDRAQLSRLPIKEAQLFQQAEAVARSQRKNIWGETQTKQPNL
jgi:endonuclease YncB( thermonuclease family)